MVVGIGYIKVANYTPYVPPLTAQDVTTWIKTRDGSRAPTNLRLLGEARGSVGSP